MITIKQRIGMGHRDCHKRGRRGEEAAWNLERVIGKVNDDDGSHAYQTALS